MNDNTLRYLSYADVVRCDVSMLDVREVVHQAFYEKGNSLVETPPKRGIAPDSKSTIRAMKAFMPSLGTGGCKWISAYPDNMSQGLPTITGLIMLNDINTGLPKAVMDCTWITAMRTAACTALSAKYLARADSRSVGIIACGLQGRTNLRALCDDFKVSQVNAFDIFEDNARRFAEEMSEELNLEVCAVKKIEEAVRGMDIVVASAPVEKEPDPPLTAGVLSSGSFMCLLDFNSTLQPNGLREVDKFVTDDQRQVSFFKRIGYLRDVPEPDGDLGKIAAGRQVGRTDADQRIVAMNMGIGLLDVATATLIYDRALEKGIGVDLPH